MLDHESIECMCRIDFISLDFSLADLSPIIHASPFSVPLHCPASLIFRKAYQLSRPLTYSEFNLC